jgi:hypothetical protein
MSFLAQSDKSSKLTFFNDESVASLAAGDPWNPEIGTDFSIGLIENSFVIYLSVKLWKRPL